MRVVNEIDPGAPEQFAELQEPGPDGPIFMLNLLKFKENAEYPDGSDSEMSGRAAYMRYGQAVGPLVEEQGGRVLYSGNVSSLFIGQVETMWDQILLVEYPNRGALLKMTTSQAYQDAAHHRKAGLAGQLLIETTPTMGLIAVAD